MVGTDTSRTLRDDADLKATLRRPRRSGAHEASGPESYRVLDEPFAFGGMGQVHLGVAGKNPSEPIFALKRARGPFVHDEDYARMLIDEANIAALVRHPNVVTTYGARMIRGELFVVMEFVRGISLAKRLRQGRIRMDVAVRIAIDVLKGLHAVHEARDPSTGEPLDIVHRDVSPQNVMIEETEAPEGTNVSVKLIDFGVAHVRRSRRSQDVTRVGELKGKLGYMAPEQLLRTRVDARTDVHAAATVLWEMLTRERLFRGATDEQTAEAILRPERPAPADVGVHVPRNLANVVMRGLAFHAADRYPTALAMAEALEEALADLGRSTLPRRKCFAADKTRDRPSPDALGPRGLTQELGETNRLKVFVVFAVIVASAMCVGMFALLK